LVRFGEGRAEADRLTELASKSSDPRPGLWATAITAIDEGDAESTQLVADQLVALGARTEAADVLAQAAAARWTVDPVVATTLARSARDALSGRAISSPALRALEEVPGLPDRVIEVARLAAGGA